MRFVIIGNPGNRRIDLFQAALAGVQLPPAQLIPYAQLLTGHINLADVIQSGDIVRIESSGQDWDVERSLLRLGAQQMGNEDGVSYEAMPLDRQPDLADLCLIRLSELNPHYPVITVDSDFRVYRRNRREVIPVIMPPDLK